MRLKDPTEWMDDLTVYVDDQEIIETAALLEPDVLYRGSKPAAAAWLSLVGILGGSFAAVTLSPGIRESGIVFAGYVVLAALLLKGLRPVTRRLLGRAIVWPASLTFFWAALAGGAAVLSAGIDHPWFAYGVSVCGGFFLGMMQGSLNPSYVKQEDEWMMTALLVGVVGTVAATLVDRHLFAGPNSIGEAALVGAVAGGLFLAPMSVLMMRLWNEAQGLASIAKLFLHNDNFALKAVAYLDSAIAMKPEDAEFYNLRGVAWSKLDEPEKAREDWQRASELRPRDADPHMNRGVDHLRRNETAQAVETFEAALVLDAENATIHSNLGMALEKAGELDRAIDQYSRAIALRPDYAIAFSNRGYAHLRRGDHDKAIADCERAFEIDPGLAMALVNRGHALKGLGAVERAAETYRAALEFQASPEVHEEALAGLESLRPRAVA